MRRVLTLSLALGFLALAVPVSGQDVTGTWVLSVDLGAAGGGDATFVLEQEGTAITGTYSGAGGDAVEVTGTVEDGVGKFMFVSDLAGEGAFEAGGSPTFQEEARGGGQARLGGIAEKLAGQIEERTGHETRSLVLGHLQRGGEPIAYDRLLALRFGSAAVELVRDGGFGCMVALRPPEVLAVPLSEAVAKLKLVPTDGDLVRTARSLGISFGDE